MKFIKTTNSTIDTVDLAEELDIRSIRYKLGDDGVYVEDADYDSALDILMQSEEEEDQ
jgi:hypothetical protein